MSFAYSTNVFLHLDLLRTASQFLPVMSFALSCFAYLLLQQAHITISQQILVEQANETSKFRKKLKKTSKSQRVCLSGRNQERTCVSCFLLSSWTCLGFPCALWFNHDVDKTGFTCVFQCLLQRVLEFFWCLYKISFASKCSHDLLIMRVWQETHRRDTEKQVISQ